MKSINARSEGIEMALLETRRKTHRRQKEHAICLRLVLLAYTLLIFSSYSRTSRILLSASAFLCPRKTIIQATIQRRGNAPLCFSSPPPTLKLFVLQMVLSNETDKSQNEGRKKKKISKELESSVERIIDGGVDSDKTYKSIDQSKSRLQTSANRNKNKDGYNQQIKRRKKKYQRKREKTPSEKERENLKMERQRKYDQVRKNALMGRPPSLWSFESLFPEPVWDDDAIRRDLYEVAERDNKKFVSEERAEMKKQARAAYAGTKQKSDPLSSLPPAAAAAAAKAPPILDTHVTKQFGRLRQLTRMRKPFARDGTSHLRIFRRPNLTNNLPYDPPRTSTTLKNKQQSQKQKRQQQKQQQQPSTLSYQSPTDLITNNNETSSTSPRVDFALTRMVEDRVYGFRRSQAGDFQYDTSLMGDGAVQFRDGVRLGKALKINADRLNYHASRELRRGHIEEAQELYERAIELDPFDGRAYLGLSRVAERRRDFKYAKECLQAGIANSRFDPNQLPPKNAPNANSGADTSTTSAVVPSSEHFGQNPYLLQALGCLEEKMGNLAEAEDLFIAATKACSHHAAAWVSLAQLRTRKLRQGAQAGRVCYQTAEFELRNAGLPPSSHVYVAWASLEYKKGNDYRRAKELFELALQCDPKCSVAYLQLGCMEADRKNYDDAKICFEKVLTFDQRNSRVLQAYAIMETKRPDGDSRVAIELFERALKAQPRDAGVLQPYALYVADLGDIDTARKLLRRATEVSKRHAPAWQAWGVLETRHGTAQTAREVFQQGIWSCAQSGGGQSGGRHCARLWQAWGVLESKEGDHAAARRCFARALDADCRNVATITAWTLMEEGLENFVDARAIFERGLKQLPSSSDDKATLWRAYEQMETRGGFSKEAQQVFQRSMRDQIDMGDDDLVEENQQKGRSVRPSDADIPPKNKREVEVVRWSSSDELRGEVWINDGSIEGRVPSATMKKWKSKKK